MGYTGEAMTNTPDRIFLNFMKYIPHNIYIYLMIGIYKITSPTGKIYIGQSNDVETRIRNYKSLKSACKKQRKLYASLVKYGPKQHIFEIICECTQPELNIKEAYYICLFNTFNSDTGMNLTSGGDSHILSEETKKKISNSNKGRGGRKKGTKPNMTPEGRAKIIAMKTGNTYCLGKRWSWSEDQKERVRGRVCSEEMREKLSVAQKKRFENTPNPFLGKTHSVETKMAISNFHKGNKWAAIKIIDIKAGTIFNSVRDAADSIGMKRSTLSMMIKNHNPNKTNFRYYTDNA